MCLENRWGHGVGEEAREVYWRSYELGDFHLVPPPSKELSQVQRTSLQSTTASQSKSGTYGNP